MNFDRIWKSDGLPESPRWLELAERLCWIDIPRRLAVAHDPRLSKTVEFDLPEKPGAIVPTNNPDTVLITMSGLICTLNVNNGGMTIVARWDDKNGTLRANDGACDAQGHLWFGTMIDEACAPPQDIFVGSIYRYDGRHIAEIADRIGCPNSLCAANGRMLYADSETGEVGFLGGGARLKLPLPKDIPGIPDGAARSRDGTIWQARWGGGCIVEFNDRGMLLNELAVPGRNVTSCCFAGTLRDHLIITVADTNGEGGVYRAYGGGTGVPENRFIL